MRSLLVICLGLMLVIACQKAENELGIVPGAPDGIGAGNLPTVTNINPGNGQELIDQNSSQSGIQGTIEITFSDYMDANTLITDNIVILNTTNGSQITSGITTEYYPEIKKLFIYIDDVPSSSTFLLRLISGGMKNTYGSPLDFDGDNNIDGSPYDDYLSTFWTQGNTDTLIDVNQPQINIFIPDTIATTDQQPLIFINFDTEMDTTTLNTSNITLTNESGSSQTLNVILKTLTNITLQPANVLATAQNYTITVKCNSIKRIGDSQTPGYLLILDGNKDGPEESEPDLQSYFRVDDPNNPPTVTVSSISGGATFTFSRLIDETTITQDNLKVYDNLGYVPGDFRIYTDTGNNYTMVDYYYKRTISGNKGAFVSRNVTATNGYKLDGNGNGIGGEDWDDYTTSF